MKISVIIPVYNTEKYLPKCLDSVLTQSFQDFEIVIVNDGSTDDSQAIIDRYLEAYPDKIVAAYQENAGQASARNRALRMAGGEYVDFLDSDDYLHPDALQTVYRIAEEKQLDVVCYKVLLEQDGQYVLPCEYSLPCDTVCQEYVLTQAIPCNKLIRRELLIQNGLFFNEGHIYEDLELIPRLALYTDKIVFLEDRLYYYFTRSGSTMQQTKFNPKLTSIFPVMQTLHDAFKGTAFEPELEYLYICHFLHDAALRFLPFPEGREHILKIARIMRKAFPHWQKNKYYKTLDVKFKIVCMLIYYRQPRLLKLLLNR